MPAIARPFAPHVVLVLLVTLLAAAVAQAGPRAELWPRWQAHDPASSLAVDHTPFARFLDGRVRTGPDGVARFAYGSVDGEARAVLDSYVESLAATAVSFHDRDEQFAYWVNLYNALTLQVVLDHYPVASIRDIAISPGWFTRGPWGRKLVSVEGENLSLDDIEHRILRPIWRDPRIHYVVNCASIGCPDLAATPYRAADLERQLTRAAKTYVNHPRAVAFERGRLVVSSIYHWYRDDFGQGDDGVLAHLRAYADPELAMRLDGVARIDSHRYDWGLNDALP